MLLAGGLLHYTNRSDGPQEQLTAEIRPGDVEIDKIFSFSVNNVGANQLSSCLSGGYSEALLHQPESQQEP